jgi:hypothetical protein
MCGLSLFFFLSLYHSLCLSLCLSLSLSSIMVVVFCSATLFLVSILNLSNDVFFSRAIFENQNIFASDPISAKNHLAKGRLMRTIII